MNFLNIQDEVCCDLDEFFKSNLQGGFFEGGDFLGFTSFGGIDEGSKDEPVSPAEDLMPQYGYSTFQQLSPDVISPNMWLNQSPPADNSSDSLAGVVLHLEDNSSSSYQDIIPQGFDMTSPQSIVQSSESVVHQELEGSQETAFEFTEEATNALLEQIKSGTIQQHSQFTFNENTLYQISESQELGVSYIEPMDSFILDTVSFDQDLEQVNDESLSSSQEIPVSVCSQSVDEEKDELRSDVHLNYSMVDSTTQYFTGFIPTSPSTSYFGDAVTSAPQYTMFSDDYLLTIPTKDLNKDIQDQGLSMSESKRLRSRRRTLKNRGYAHTCRQKRVGKQQAAQEEKQALRDEIVHERSERMRLQKRMRSLELRLAAAESG